MIKFKSAKVERWVTLFVVALVGGIITKLPYLKDTYYSTLEQATGSTKAQLGMLLTMYGLMNFVCYFPGGMLADKVSPKKLIIISCFGTGIVGLWYSTLPGYSSLLLIHCLFGITTVFTFWASMVKITNNLGDENEQGKLFGFLEGGRGLVGTLVALGSVYVFAKFASDIKGLSGAIVFYSVMLMIAGVLVILFVHDPKLETDDSEESSSVSWKDFKTVIKIPRVWLCGLIVACNYGAVMLFGYLTPYFTEIYSMSSSATALLGVFRSYALMLIGSLIGGLMADKMKSVIRFMQYGFIGMTVFSFLYLLIPVNRSMLWVVVGNFILHGLFLLAVKALYFAPIDEIHISKKLAGTASGIISIVGYSPEIYGYTAAGTILDKNPGITGYNILFILTGILSIVGLILVIILRRNNNKYTLSLKK
ncbi:MFS transporter [Muricomes intestini]|jgi:nitrate/nitrite transporter NarK|uniref:MFS transporter n=2 Tax=Muricomes intestini TaxID=1796634 RepID=UPI000E87BC88|nr:MFS transporter [Lachnospiraceae bacterium]HBI74567.1 MFS transporter [Lachnospiraceae bacterium]HCR82560.1 MFS transporter [Lachnospiraceae bacterium]